MFLERHALTTRAELHSAITGLWPDVDVPAGMYDHGLLTVLDTDVAARLLRAWTNLSAFIPVIATAFGDLYVAHKRTHVIYWLNVQHGVMDFVDRELAWVLGEFLDNEGIVSEVLQKPKLERLRCRYSDLQYGELYVLQPWLMLGGADADENYTIGRLDVYLELVGQTHGGRVAIEDV